MSAQGNQYMPMDECMKENERERKREGGVESNQFLSKPKTLDYTGPQRDHKGLDCTFIFSQYSNLGDIIISILGIFVCFFF